MKLAPSHKRELMRAKIAVLGPCPDCGFQMVRSPRGTGRGQSSLDASLDHIRPRAQGGSDRLENLRVVCKLCNQSRAAADHCVGAMACVRAVLGRRRPTVGEVSRTWLAWRARAP